MVIGSAKDPEIREKIYADRETKMKAKILTAPMGGISATAGSILLIGTFFYLFLGAAPVTGVAQLHTTFGLVELISLDSFFTLGHMAVYGALTLGLCAIFKAADRRPAIAATLTGIGVGIEVLQEEFFGRQFQLGDMAANVTGIAIAMAFLSIIAWRGRRRRHRF